MTAQAPLHESPDGEQTFGQEIYAGTVLAVALAIAVTKNVLGGH